MAKRKAPERMICELDTGVRVEVEPGRARVLPPFEDLTYEGVDCGPWNQYAIQGTVPTGVIAIGGGQFVIRYELLSGVQMVERGIVDGQRLTFNGGGRWDEYSAVR